jgi:hypothetical protein
LLAGPGVYLATRKPGASKRLAEIEHVAKQARRCPNSISAGEQKSA